MAEIVPKLGVLANFYGNLRTYLPTHIWVQNLEIVVTCPFQIEPRGKCFVVTLWMISIPGTLKSIFYTLRKALVEMGDMLGPR